MYHLFIGFLKEIFRKALLNGFYQHVEDAETPTDHIFFLIFMSAILVNDNFMGTWFRKIPRSLRFGTFIDKVIQELSQPNSLSLLLSRMDAYLRIQHLQEYDKPCRCLTEREISVWKLAILYFFEMFVLESLAGPCFLNIPLTEDLMHELRTYIDRYQIYDPALSMMGYFKRKANKFTNHIKHMMEELEFLKKTNPSARLTGGVRLQRGQKFNFCYFCLKTNCTRCRLCNPGFLLQTLQTLQFLFST